MTDSIKLSTLTQLIQDSIQSRFDGEIFTVSARIMNVKKYISARRCYLTMEEYEYGAKITEIRAVFWSNAYSEIEKFEKVLKQPFKDGAEITCKVKVRYHKVYGLNLDVLQIDVAQALGTLELERQQTLERLVKEHPEQIQLIGNVYHTYNNRLELPLVISRIALITAPNSDGQRDFLQELKGNKHEYQFSVTEFLTTIQGDNAHELILEQLRLIEKRQEDFDVVAIVRGGGSISDFRPFDDYTLSAYVAGFPVPVFTGIGHDRNQSIVDLMAREQKTPTKVAALIVEHNFDFENVLIDLKTRMSEAVTGQLERATERLEQAKRIIRLSSPRDILRRGFAIITHEDKIVVDPSLIKEGMEIQTQLMNTTIHSTVTKKTKNEKQTDL
ncbi:MAG: exodeoxyribonuclease VII large subunit [Chitinophagales bacterium]|nr:exodeoxyribonuclease VII large subunit [Chitinophagales bacterium]